MNLYEFLKIHLKTLDKAIIKCYNMLRKDGKRKQPALPSLWLR